MRLMLLMVLALAVGVTGCSSKTRNSPNENAQAIEADTAEVDASDTSEPLIETLDQEAAPVVAEEAVTPPAETPAEATNEAPIETVADTSAPAAQGTGEMATYVVQKDDTLMKIAFNIYGDIGQWKTLYELNKGVLRSASRLTAGTQIKYDKPASEPVIERNGDSYLIKQGDTLGTIADDVYAKRSKWKKIYENNRTLIRDPNKIYAGFYLYYQISEQERQEAEAIKAKRGQSLGSIQPTRQPLKGGLDNLAAPSKDRGPASTPN